MATTSASTDARAGSTATASPAARAATEVVGRMQAATGGTGSGRPSVSRSRRYADTAEAEAKVTTSASATVAATSARGGGASTVRYAITSSTRQPLPTSPAPSASPRSDAP